MLVRGDLNKVLEEVNKILKGAFTRIEALEDKLQALGTPENTGDEAKRGPGRPPGSKNKPK